MSIPSIFALPQTSRHAGQVFYGLAVAGLVNVPVLFIVFRRFIESGSGIDVKDFFFLFTVIYAVILVICTNRVAALLRVLSKRLDVKLPSDVTVVAPAAANCGRPEVIAIGRKYWFWQLVGGYLTGVTYGWFATMIFLFLL